jgi:dihydrofolate reductase
MARKVILFIATSIDGFVADENGDVDWLEANIRGNEMDDSYDKMYAQIDTVLMGRTTYDQVTKELSPEKYLYEDKLSYIITTHPEASSDTRIFTSEAPVALLEKLKKQSGADIWIIGGPQIIQPLLAADLIDTFILTTIPIFLGKELPLYDTLPQPLPVQLKEVYAKNELVYAVYQR